MTGNYKTVVVKNGFYTQTPNAIGFKVVRNDGVLLRDIEYFPKSQIEYQVRLNTTEFKIPFWLYFKKISSGYEILCA